MALERGAQGAHGEQGRGQVTHTHLDQAPDPAGTPGPPSLVSTPEQKRAAADAIEKHIQPDTRTAATKADVETASAIKEFGGKDGGPWETCAGLKKVDSAWNTQVATLMSRLDGEKGMLRQTNFVFQNTDLGVGNQVRQSSSLDQY